MIYVLNTSGGALSRYSGLCDNAIGVAAVGEELFAATADALHQQTGTTDGEDPIICYVTTGRLMAGDRNAQKEVHHLWSTHAALDDVEVTMYNTSWEGEETIGPFDAEAVSVPVNSGEPYNRITRGLLGEPGQWWQIKIGNKDGGEFDLYSLVLVLDQTKIHM